MATTNQINLGTPKSSIPWTKLVIIMWVMVFVGFLIVDPLWKVSGYQSIISWDVFGYYIYLPAQFIYHDLFHLAFLPQLMDKYHPSDVAYQAHLLPTGGYVMNYTLGLSILYLPFFFVGHLVALLGFAPADGLSWPYQLSIYMAGGFYSLMGLVVIRKVLKQFFTEAIVAATLFLLAFVTNYFHYSVVEAGMPHTYLFFLYAVLLWFTILWHRQPKLWMALVMGMALGLMTLMRPTELLAALIPILWNVYNWESLKAKVNLLWKYRLHVIALGLTVFVIGATQLVYWKMATGHFLFYSYGDQKFYFAHPHLFDGLFSIKKGWLIYTPIMGFSLLGLIPLYRQYRNQFFPLLLFTVINIYVVYSWWCWWYGGSFGARAMIQSYALLVLPLGAWVQMISKKRFLALLFGLFAMFCLVLNQFQDWQLRQGLYSTEGMTRYAYKLVFFKTAIDKNVLIKFDNPEQLQLDTAAFEKTTLLNQTLWPEHAVSEPRYDDTSVLLLDYQYQGITPIKVPVSALGNIKGAWLKVSIAAYFKDFEWSYYHMGVIEASYYGAEGKLLKINNMRIQHLIGNSKKESYGKPNEWDRVVLESKLPDNLLPTDSLFVKIYNPGGRGFYIDDLKIELLHH